MSRALVVGLARSGRAAALLLAREGWAVVAVDAAAVDAPSWRRPASRCGRPTTGRSSDVDLVVKSPGVPGAAPPVAAARAAGVPVWSEVELAARRLPNRLIGVTGTNGKTTTTELTAHVLRAAGVRRGGLRQPGDARWPPWSAPSTPDDWLVVECSSFQLEDAHALHPRAAVLLNLAPDHLDRHGDLSRLPRREAAALPGPGARGPGHPPGPAGARPGGAPARRLSQEGRARTSPPGPPAACTCRAGPGGPVGRICPCADATTARTRWPPRRWPCTPARRRRRSPPGLAGFPGVAHRLEVVGEAGGVRYVNDSKATNPEAAMAALDAYPGGVHLIAGGRAKGTPFGAAGRGRPAGGGAGLPGGRGRPRARGRPGRRRGAERAGGRRRGGRRRGRPAGARPGETVLLAPACASFDQFPGYEARGEAFRAAVRELLSG